MKCQESNAHHITSITGLDARVYGCAWTKTGPILHNANRKAVYDAAVAVLGSGQLLTVRRKRDAATGAFALTLTFESGVFVRP